MNGAEEWLLYSAPHAVCDVIESVCSGYIIRSDQLQQMIIIFRGTRTKKQLFQQGWQGLQPGVDFYGIGKVGKLLRPGLQSVHQ